MIMLYRYKEACTLRDKIGMCPNIEVELDMTYKPPFSFGHMMSRKKIKILKTKK